MFSCGFARLIRAGCPLMFSLIFIVPRSYAQAEPGALPDPPVHTVAAAGEVSSEPTGTADAQIPPAIAKQLAAMQKRIEQLEAKLKEQGRPAAADDLTKAVATVNQDVTLPPPPVSPTVAQPAKKAKIAPFSDYDWTWLNGNPRNKDVAFDSKFFTPEIRGDVTYAYDFNKPKDNSMGGSSELFRSNEIQLEQFAIGGDFHWENVRARFLTDWGLYSTATPRNDPSPAKGQWDLANAYRGLAEAYAGYHLNVWNGINIDAGLFPSYVGLFSFYNFDNWAYQPSYVSSNTPWFFEGVRVQIFPTAHLKIEPWFINGWQSLGSSNSRKGLGGQIKWTPKPWLDIVSNEYGLGHDDLYVPNRGRIHTDNSIEVKYYDKPKKFLDKMAFSLTGDLGCEFGPSTTTSGGAYVQGVGCFHNTKDPKSMGQNTNANNQNPTDPTNSFQPGIDPKQSFVGYMIYNRMWFHKDLYAVTVGGGQINNPGRYLVLVPPINGESAGSAALNSPYFPFNPGDPFKAWDASFTFDYMPRQWITFRAEYDYRHASVGYFSGPGGITPPAFLGASAGTNNGFPAQFACMNGSPSLSVAGCASNGGLWTPDLRKSESLIDIDLMVKF
jgi:hypothetical protein